MEHRLRDSSASAMTTEAGDMMDLKAEIVSLKNKLFMADQRRMTELTDKTIALKKVERDLAEATSLQQRATSDKEQAVRAAQNDSKNMINSFKEENALLKARMEQAHSDNNVFKSTILSSCQI